MTHKAKYERSGARIIKTRHMKSVHKSGYLRDLQQKACCDIETLNDPNDMWYANAIHRQTCPAQI